MQKLNDLSRCLTPLELDGTLIAVIEMSQSSWLVASIIPGVERQPLKKIKVDENTLLNLLHRWREEAEKAGHRIKRISVAFEAGRDGFWLALAQGARHRGPCHSCIERRHAGARGVVAKYARPTRRRALCRAHWLARRERHKTARERASPFGQRSSSAGHDPIGMAISHVPEKQRLGAVVPNSYQKRPRQSQAT
jgi:hypothetical protein